MIKLQLIEENDPFKDMIQTIQKFPAGLIKDIMELATGDVDIFIDSIFLKSTDEEKPLVTFTYSYKCHEHELNSLKKKLDLLKSGYNNSFEYNILNVKKKPMNAGYALFPVIHGFKHAR